MTESNKNGLAKTVKRLRGKQGLSQEKLARLADVSNNTIINIEAGKYTRSLHDSGCFLVEMREFGASNP